MANIKSKIELIDEEITKVYTKPDIDFTQHGWEEKMRAIDLEYRAQVKEELEYIRQAILESLENEKYANMYEIFGHISNTTQLKYYLSPSTDEITADTTDNKNLLYALISFVMRNLMPDARDELLYFNDLLQQECRKNKINYTPFIKKLLPYASDKVKFGNYSVKGLFESALKE